MTMSDNTCTNCGHADCPGVWPDDLKVLRAENAQLRAVIADLVEWQQADWLDDKDTRGRVWAAARDAVKERGK